ncbi:MAG: hypothetical protein JHC26_07440 [Thermofilum sp.]|uniref:hypothetical protein n=1 Tax=Thermofilum sp. TaxID=1961369 RepID=UPI0025844C0C|nr:hypothetical protein [Thermofilum sp.]MCI4408910.1 hypothetical protein [Thermofilum sp.]
MLYELLLLIISFTIKPSQAPPVSPPTISLKRPKVGVKILTIEEPSVSSSLFYESDYALLALPAKTLSNMPSDEPEPTSITIIGTQKTILSDELEKILSGGQK